MLSQKLATSVFALSLVFLGCGGSNTSPSADAGTGTGGGGGLSGAGGGPGSGGHDAAAGNDGAGHDAAAGNGGAGHDAAAGNGGADRDAAADGPEASDGAAGDGSTDGSAPASPVAQCSAKINQYTTGGTANVEPYTAMDFCQLFLATCPFFATPSGVFSPEPQFSDEPNCEAWYSQTTAGSGLTMDQRRCTSYEICVATKDFNEARAMDCGNAEGMGPCAP